MSCEGDLVCAVHHPTHVSIYNVENDGHWASEVDASLEFSIALHRPSTRTSSVKFIGAQAWVACSYDNAPHVEAFDLEVVDEARPTPSRRATLSSSNNSTVCDVSASALLPISDRVVLAACSDGTVKAIDLRREAVTTMTRSAQTQQRVFGAQTATHVPLTALSSAGQLIAAGDARGAVVLYDARSFSAPLVRWEPTTEVELQPVTSLHVSSASPHDVVVNHGPAVGLYLATHGSATASVQIRSRIVKAPQQARMSTGSVVAEDLHSVLTPCLDGASPLAARLMITHLVPTVSCANDNLLISTKETAFQSAAVIAAVARGKRQRTDDDAPHLASSVMHIPDIDAPLSACARLPTTNGQVALVVGSAEGEICVLW